MNEGGNEAAQNQPSSGVIADFMEGGVPRLLLSKPVQEAIGRLIYAATDIPVAKLQQWAQSIRDDTTNQKLFSTGIASKAKERAVQDSDLIDRGVERWTRQLGKRQKARENVATKTIEILDGADETDSVATPSEEFMGLFEDVAEKATSEELADLLARILAGEIRKPGTVSRRTLQTASILDAEIVTALNTIRPYIFSTNCAHIPPTKADEWRPLLSLLNSVSIINEPGMRSFIRNGELIGTFAIGDDVIVVTAKSHPLTTWVVDGFNLTPIGVELVSVLPFHDKVDVEDVARGILEHDLFVARVQVGKLIKAENCVDMTTLRSL